MDVSTIFGFVEVVPLGVALIIGFIIKNVVPSDYINRFIPLISALVGVLVVLWTYGTLTPEYLLSGLVSGLAATGLYEAVNQLIEKGLTPGDTQSS